MDKIFQALDKLKSSAEKAAVSLLTVPTPVPTSPFGPLPKGFDRLPDLPIPRIDPVRVEREKKAAKKKEKKDKRASQQKGIEEASGNFQKKIASAQEKVKKIQGIAASLEKLSEPGVKLREQLNKLSTTAHVTGNKLHQLELLGRENAKTFGGSATKSVATYTALVNQLSPNIAQVPSALAAMGNSVSVTSKLMGGDAAAATTLLTTAMKSYNVSTKDPTKASKEMASMMNVMAAASQSGSASLPRIQAALQKVGTGAKQAGLSFEETNAAIQILDANGQRGAKGGEALQGVLGALANTKILPDLQAAGVDINTLTNNSLSLSERLAPLQGVMSNTGLMTKVFSESQRDAASALIGNVNSMSTMTEAIGGTTAAYTEAEHAMDSPTEKSSRFAAKVEDLKIRLFNASGGLMAYASNIKSLAGDVGHVFTVFDGFAKVLPILTNALHLQGVVTKVVSFATKAWGVAQNILNIALSPMVLIPVAIAAIGAGLVWLANNTTGWGEALDHTISGAKSAFLGFITAVQTPYYAFFQGIMAMIDEIKIGFYTFKNLLGLGDEEKNNEELLKSINARNQRAQNIADFAKKAGDHFKDSGESFSKAASSVRIKRDKEDEIPATKQDINLVSKLGGVPSFNHTKNPPFLGAGNSSAATSGLGSATNKAISNGGGKQNGPTINLKSLVENLTIKGEDFKENSKQMRDQVLDELLGLLGSAETTIA